MGSGRQLANPVVTMEHRGGKWRKVVLPLILCAPGLLLLLVVFLVPLARTFLLSFQTPAGDLTAGNYTKLLSDGFFWELLFRTLKLSALTTLTTLVLGYAVAIHFVGARPRTRAYLTLIILAPLMVSVVIRTYGWVIVLGPAGLVNTLLSAMNLSSAPIRILFTELAVVIGLTHIFLPYMTLAIVSSLQNVDPALTRAARNLGASDWTAFLRIVLPLSMPGILAGSLLVFTLSNSAFATPALLGGSGAQVLSLLAYQQNLVLLNWNVGSAIGIVLLVVVMTGAMLNSRLIEGGPFRGVFR
jgi:putative spermidine/putrescine transport system permease protein